MAPIRREDEQDGRDAAPLLGLADFILARIEADGTSTRQISAKTGIGRSRLHAVLHTRPEKRPPMRLDETAAVLDAIGVSQLEATLAADLMKSANEASVHDVCKIASMLSELLHGLPEQLADIVEHIDGLEYGDIRREHGKRVRALVVKVLTDEYTDMVQRREFRIAALRD